MLLLNTSALWNAQFALADWRVTFSRIGLVCTMWSLGASIVPWDFTLVKFLTLNQRRAPTIEFADAQF